MTMIYFDNNATTPIAPEVQEVYLETLKVLGNPSSIHQAGQRARSLLESAREQVAELLHVPDPSISFHSGGTEALNAVLIGSFLPLGEKKHLIVSRVEHAAVLETAKYLAAFGVEVSFLEVDTEGKMDPAQLKDLIRDETALIAVMYANNETGNIHPIAELGHIAQEHMVPLLCDGVQAVGKVPLNLTELPVDYFVASAHKFHGPQGVGWLYTRPGLRPTPLIHGGRQERGGRAGTENLPGIVAQAQALELACQDLSAKQQRVRALRDRLQSGLSERIPGMAAHGDPQDRLAGTLNVSFPQTSGESALINLDLAGMAVSIGSACDSGSIEASHVLLAMGLTEEAARNGIRFSLSDFNTEEEVNRALEIVPQVVARIQSAA